MTSIVRRIIGKIRRDGWVTTAKVAGQLVHTRLFPTPFDFELIPGLLEEELRARGALTLVQVGANVGPGESDQIYKFFERHCSPAKPAATRVRAVLIEPVRHLYDKLIANYAGFAGVTCMNVAIAERAGIKQFYRLRENIDLAEHGLPPYAEQLGSFLRKNLDNLWAHDPGNSALKDFVCANIVEDTVSCLRLEQVLEQEQIAAVDLLQVDTEGYDYQILRSLDFARLRPRYINYERIHLRKDEPACRRLLLRQGYRFYDHGQDTLCTWCPGVGWLTRARERIYNLWLKAIY